MSTKNAFTSEVIKSVIISLITALILVLVFALFIKLFSFSDLAIKIASCIIKIVAVFVGTFLIIKNEQGFIKGGIAGLISLVLEYILFALLGGGLSFGVAIIWEILLGFTIGAGSGILAVNLKK